MEMITFFFGLLGVGYVIWGLISPFVVIGLTTRVHQLEGQLDLLRKERQRALSRETPPAAVATAPPDKRTDWSSERFHNPLSTIAAANREASPSDTAARIPAASASPQLPSPVLEPDPWVDPLVTHERQMAENKAQEFVHHAILEPDDVEPPPLPVSAIESSATSVAQVEKISKAAPVQDNRQQSATAIKSDRDEPSTLEEILAGKWLTWVGALAVIIGAGFGFKYAVENNWVGPRERVIIGFLMSMAAASISAWLYRGQHRMLKLLPGEHPGDPPRTLDASSLFGIAVYLMGVVMCTLEVHVQGTSRDWHTATSLAVTLVWTTYAMLTLIMGISWRSGWIRVFSLGLFVLTVGKVFLFDVWHLDTVIRVFAFISLGVALLLVSFLYRRFRDRIRSWMAPGVMEH